MKLDPKKPVAISFTGADDKTDLKKMIELDNRWPGYIEWGILYFPEKQGQPRNPSDSWIRELTTDAPWMMMTAHLCGQQVFEDLLNHPNPEHYLLVDPHEDPDALLSDGPLLGFDAYQLNINARKPQFTDNQVCKLYDKFFDRGLGIVLQKHQASEEVIHRWLRDKVQGLSESDYASRLDNVRILYDESRGTGKMPEHWPMSSAAAFPEALLSRRYAGGMNEDNIVEANQLVNAARAMDVGPIRRMPYVLDLESGCRDGNNQFDLGKVERILEKIFGERQ